MDHNLNKSLQMIMWQATDAGDLDRAASALAPDLIATMPGAPGPMDLAGFRAAVAMFLAAFSDAEHKVLSQVCEGDLVAGRLYWSGRHTSDFNGIPATGNRVGFDAQATSRVRDGKIVEHHVQFDLAGFIGQLTAKAA